MTDTEHRNPDERGISKDEQIARLRAELDRFKPQPMSQLCRDGKHNGTGDDRCIGCYCLCHSQDAEVKRLRERAVPDRAYVRAYNNARDRHRNAVLREVADSADRTRLLLERIEDESSPLRSSLIAGETRHLATNAARAWARAEALAAVDEVSFLTADPDAEH